MKVASLFTAILLAQILFGQKSGITLENGDAFEFKNGFKEWSEPIKAELFTGNKSKSIPIQLRIKFQKRLILACHYQLEITNLSPDKKVTLAYGNDYRDLYGKRIWKKVKLRPNGSATGKIMFAEKGFEPSDAESCLMCKWRLDFSDVYIK